MDAIPTRRPPALLLTLFGVLASAISGVAYWYYASQKAALEREVSHQVLAIADTKVRQISDWRAQQLGHVRFILADQMSLTVLSRLTQGRGSAADNAQAQAWMAGLCRELHYANAYLTDREGRTMLREGRAIGSEAHIRILALEVIRKGEISLNDLHMEDAGTIHLGINLPLRLDRDSAPFGTLLLALDPNDYLYPLLQAWPVPSGSGEMLLVRREGDEVLYLNPLRHRQNTAMRMRLPLARTDAPAVKAVHGFEGVTEGRDYRGVPVFSAIRKVPEMEWYLVAKLDSGEVRAALRWRSALLGTVAASLILAAVAIVLVLWRRQQLQSESLFRSTFEQAGVGMVHVSCAGWFVRVNQRFCDITGYSSEELLRLRPEDISHPEDHPADREGIEGLLSGRLVNFSRNKRYIHKDGSIICARLTASALRTPAGSPVHLIGMVEDITEQVRAEDALRRSEERFRLVVEHAPDGILVDTGLTFRYANAEAMRMFGASNPAELIGRGVLERMHPAERASVADRAKTVAAGGPAKRTERRCLRLNGEVFSTEISLVPIEYEGQPSVLVFMRDISQRKRSEEERAALEEQLRQAQKMESVGRLAGGVAHDFNNLLTVINGYSDMLQNEKLSEAEVSDGLTEIRIAGERAASLTQQLLAFSRKQIAEPKPISLNEVVQEEKKMLQRLIGEDVEVITRLAPDLELVLADRSQMHQVLMNLTVNARDAMPGGGTITIETSNVDVDPEQLSCAEARSGAHVLLTVADTGSGMNTETLHKIFEPFFTTKPRGTGTGLGLSTVYGIVRQSGGWIQVSSEVGKGSKFMIFLPRTSEVPMSSSQCAPVVESRGDETILIVEDQAELRKLALGILSHNGYRLLEAANGAEALAVAVGSAEPIDLLLTDVVMPGMTGRELAGRLKQARPRMKTLYMSGYPADFIGRQGVLEPGVAYLPKPFTPVELSLKVRDVLGKPEPASILIIDDDEAVRSLVAQMLARSGYRVLMAANGIEGCRLVDENIVNMVITDLVMPEREGLETVRYLRKNHGGIPVLAISGAFDGDFLKAAQLFGADDALRKPLDAQTLLPKVRRLLDSVNAER